VVFDAGFLHSLAIVWFRFDHNRFIKSKVILYSKLLSSRKIDKSPILWLGNQFWVLKIVFHHGDANSVYRLCWPFFEIRPRKKVIAGWTNRRGNTIRRSPLYKGRPKDIRTGRYNAAAICKLLVNVKTDLGLHTCSLQSARGESDCGKILHSKSIYGKHMLLYCK